MDAAKLILVFLLASFTGFSQVPDTDDFTLTDVTNEINPSANTLWTCFDEADPDKFDPAYEGDKDRLSNFRNYNGNYMIHNFQWNCQKDSLNVSNRTGSNNSPQGVYVADDYSAMFWVDHAGDVYQYDMDNNDPYYVSLSSYNDVKWNLDEISLEDIHWRGARDVYLMRDDGKLMHYGTGEDWTLTSTYQVKGLVTSISTDYSGFTAFYINENGSYFYMMEYDQNDNSYLRQYSIDDGDIETYQHVRTVEVAGAFKSGMCFSDDGKRVYFAETNNNDIYEYVLDDAWDISTMSQTTKFEEPTELNAYAIKFSKDGDRLYAVEQGDETIYQYTEIPALKAVPSSHTVDFSSNTVTSDVYSESSWSASSNRDWATYSTSGTDGCGEITINVDKNESSESRSALITIDNGTETEKIIITQEGI